MPMPMPVPVPAPVPRAGAGATSGWKPSVNSSVACDHLKRMAAGAARSVLGDMSNALRSPSNARELIKMIIDPKSDVGPTHTKARAESATRIALRPDPSSNPGSVITINTSALPMVLGRETASQQNGSGLTDKHISRQHLKLTFIPADMDAPLLVTALGRNPLGFHRSSLDSEVVTLLWRGQQQRLALGDRLSLYVDIMGLEMEANDTSSAVCSSRCALTYTVVDLTAEASLAGLAPPTRPLPSTASALPPSPFKSLGMQQQAEQNEAGQAVEAAEAE